MKKALLFSISLCTLALYSCQKNDSDNAADSSTGSLMVSRSAIEVGTMAGYTDTFTIQSDIDWIITLPSGASSWLSIDTLIGYGTKTLKVTVLTSNTVYNQKAVISITPSKQVAGTNSQTLTITQNNPGIAWQQSFGGTANDNFNEGLPTVDGGFVFAGQTSSNNGDVSPTAPGNGDGWIVKVDANGNKLWQVPVGTTKEEGLFSIAAATDGGYVSTGYSGSDLMVVKVNASGVLQWTKYFGGTGDEVGYKILSTSDGGFIIAGSTTSSNGDVKSNHGATDLWLLRLDASGSKVWETTYGGPQDDLLGTVIATTDGGYLVGGTTYSSSGDAPSNHGGVDYLLVKVDGSGNKTWSKVCGGQGDDILTSLALTNDGGYAVAGYTQSNDGDVSGNHLPGFYDMWVLKLSSKGENIWQTALGGTNDDVAYSITALSDGNFMVSGYANSEDGDVTGNHGSADLWIVKLNKFGKKLWQRPYGGPGNDQGAFITTTSDGGFLTGGFASADGGDVSNNKGNADGWIVKIK